MTCGAVDKYYLLVVGTRQVILAPNSPCATSLSNVITRDSNNAASIACYLSKWLSLLESQPDTSIVADLRNHQFGAV